MIYDIPLGGDELCVAWFNWSIGLRTECFNVIYGYGWTISDIMIIDLLRLLTHYFFVLIAGSTNPPTSLQSIWNLTKTRRKTDSRRIFFLSTT